MRSSQILAHHQLNFKHPSLKLKYYLLINMYTSLIIGAKFMVICSYRWSLIAGRLPGRTDNEIKNYWNTHIRRKLLSRGVDPTTHRPIHEMASSDVTISFVKEEEKVASFALAEETRRNQETSQLRCPDLNLELCISPPSYQDSPASLRSGGSLCFSCSLGLKKSEDCTCNGFLGMERGVLDYRSLEMK
eukprot:TRINITY_DN2731_c1_g5_i1.p1 TRINITY_DN2731_c1_g5~~TRINITY_DN2731_c1_g5_i1.p1  ORF type:complete len:189 (-),score=22.18 TRINITY_DN2731_c1_g5_i1:374-940(-)